MFSVLITRGKSPWPMHLAKKNVFGLAPAARTRTNRTKFEASILETLTWNSRGFCKTNYCTSWKNDFSAFRDSFTKVKCFKIRYTCLELKVMKRKKLTILSRIKNKKKLSDLVVKIFLILSRHSHFDNIVKFN